MDKCTIVYSWSKGFQHNTTYVAILLTISSISVLLNLTLIISFIATRQVTKNTSNILIFVVSISDLATGAVTMPLTASLLLNVNTEDFCTKSKVLLIAIANSHFSVVLTVLLAMDRYLHMNPNILNNHGSRIKNIFKIPNIYYMMIIIFIFLLSAFTILLFDINTTLKRVIVLFFVYIIAVNMLIIVCLYTRGYLRIRKFTDNNPVYNESGGSTHTTPDYVRRLYKTVLVLILLAFFQYVPLCVVQIIAQILLKRNVNGFPTIFSYFFEFASLSSNAGCFTNCVAVLYFNNQAKNWILTKLGIDRTTNQSR